MHTDHENLTRIYSTGSPKVLRWKLRIQEYNFTLVFKKGILNIVADALSRLCLIYEISFDDEGFTLEEEVYSQS